MQQVESLARPAAQARRAATRLAELARFQGEQETFWPAWLEAVGTIFDARRVLLLDCAPDQSWQAKLQWPPGAADMPGDAERAFALSAEAQGGDPVLTRQGSLALACSIGQAADQPQDQPAVALVIFLQAAGSPDRLDAPRLLALIELAASVPVSYLASRHAAVAPVPAAPRADAGERLFDVLRMSIELGGETRFLRAAFGLCNQLAVRFRCDRVCLGWFEGAYVRLVAVSHVEKFDRRANAARDLETAMEEAATQDAEIVWPSEGEARVIARGHEAYARAQGTAHLLSLPLRIDDEVCAVLSFERHEAALDAHERFELRLIGEACARPLKVLRHSDRWFGARAFAALRRGRDALLGPSYTAWKLIGMGLAAVAVVLALLPWPYRVEAPIALRSSDIVFVPAPFDGYLKQVHVEVGDATPAGAPLLELDTRELVLEESMALADELRYAREAEKAQAARQLADMQIALARQQQSGAKLELIRHQIASAQVRAPFAGVVVEGDLRKNLGAPVRKGDLLLKLAHTANLYLELEVDQVDIHEVRPGMTGAFAFVGRPDLRYPVEVERVDPAATMREGRNIYLVRARIDSVPEAWWRPGMGGAARLDVGDRPAIWIITHRTVRFLRQVFWL
jgi:multidrug resistance efflux pump